MKPSKLSFIIYEPGNSPRYFEIKKSLFRFLFFGLPTIALLCALAISTMGVYFKQIQYLNETKEPTIINQLKQEKTQLVNKLKELETERDNLTNKLTLGNKSQKGALNSLQFFKQSAGRRDLTKSPELTLEEIEITPLSESLEVDFKIVNLTQETRRVSGYIFVIMQAGNQINVWPNNAFADKEMQIEFNNGELFATSRFRPVKAIFSLPKANEALFKTLIFNKTGDLIFRQIISRNIRN